MTLSNNDLLKILHEDCPWGDLTTETLGIGENQGLLTFTARKAMTVCGSEEAVTLFELAGARADYKIKSGQTVAADTLLLEAEGSVASLHIAWKVAQTLMEASSGIATGAATIVNNLRSAGFTTPLACTRKNFPGTKALASKAVKAGGAVMHRLGLSETVLIFPEHLRYTSETPSAIVARFRVHSPEKKIVVEVTSRDAAIEWAIAGADVLQLEKFLPAEIAAFRKKLVGLMPEQLPVLAAAGGVTVNNAVEYASAGADLLVSSAPYFAPPADVQVTFLD